MLFFKYLYEIEFFLYSYRDRRKPFGFLDHRLALIKLSFRQIQNFEMARINTEDINDRSFGHYTNLNKLKQRLRNCMS